MLRGANDTALASQHFQAQPRLQWRLPCAPHCTVTSGNPLHTPLKESLDLLSPDAQGTLLFV